MIGGRTGRATWPNRSKGLINLVSCPSEVGSTSRYPSAISSQGTSPPYSAMRISNIVSTHNLSRSRHLSPEVGVQHLTTRPLFSLDELHFPSPILRYLQVMLHMTLSSSTRVIPPGSKILGVDRNAIGPMVNPLSPIDDLFLTLRQQNAMLVLGTVIRV